MAEWRRSAYVTILLLGLAGIGCLVAFFAVGSPSKAELIAEVAQGGGRLDLEAKWSTRRGRAPSVLGKKDSFRLGVLTMELALAEKRNDWKTIQLETRNIRRILGSARAPELITLATAIGSPRQNQRAGMIELLEQLLAESSWLLDTSQYGLGCWSRLAWGALERGRPDLIDGFASFARFPEAGSEAKTLKARILSRVEEGRLELARQDLRQILEGSGFSD